MKRFLVGIACAIFILIAVAPCAMANSWGLTGALLKVVSSVHTWDDYTSLGKQASDAAVMHNRYHNALMIADNLLHVYTKAVYQPEDKCDSTVKLIETKDGFALSYGEAERYAFCVDAGTYTLKEAVIGNFTMTAFMKEDGVGSYFTYYEGTDGVSTAIWNGRIPLSDFNINLFPRSVDEIRHLNLMRAALGSGRNCLGWREYPDEPGTRYIGFGKGTEPVYAAPFGESSWRASNGKASVGLNGEFWQLGAFKNADGEAYACIRYNISTRTQRIGYIRGTVLDKQADTLWEPKDNFLNVGVQAQQDTYLTDDPDVSQYPQFQVPKGTQFACLGLYGSNYAYVAAEVRSGLFVDGGEIVWGFVPLKALVLDESDAFRSERQTGVMKSMVGEWAFYAGGNMAEDVLVLNAEGTYTGRHVDLNTGEITGETHGIWYVTKNNPNWNLYWNDPEYELYLIRDDGTANVKGLVLNAEGFSLTNEEGGGGYMKPEDML
jgi:hypothetical protein